MSVLIRFDGAQGSGKTLLRKAVTKFLKDHGVTVQERDKHFKSDNDDLIVSDIDFAALVRSGE
jgi:uridine kinase